MISLSSTGILFFYHAPNCAWTWAHAKKSSQLKTLRINNFVLFSIHASNAHLHLHVFVNSAFVCCLRIIPCCAVLKQQELADSDCFQEFCHLTTRLITYYPTFWPKWYHLVACGCASCSYGRTLEATISSEHECKIKKFANHTKLKSSFSFPNLISEC